jgi:tetrahydromethanopterin S-methyltransferase subunit G
MSTTDGDMLQFGILIGVILLVILPILRAIF